MQRTWNITEIAQIAKTIAAVGPNADFAAGVYALAFALNAPVQLPERREPMPLIIVDANGQEVTR